jgi:FtsZ-interacting cell division protein ZipA
LYAAGTLEQLAAIGTFGTFALAVIAAVVLGVWRRRMRPSVFLSDPTRDDPVEKRLREKAHVRMPKRH